ncbi:MAG: hypothetical protein O2856_17145, partial [Planctomycetota bacterium]|nr:hypothetical protein [Planctomycetota bacterium]
QLAEITREFDCRRPNSARDQSTVPKVLVSKIPFAFAWAGQFIMNTTSSTRSELALASGTHTEP